jgi:hypothetical protein
MKTSTIELGPLELATYQLVRKHLVFSLCKTHAWLELQDALAQRTTELTPPLFDTILIAI